MIRSDSVGVTRIHGGGLGHEEVLYSTHRRELLGFGASLRIKICKH